MTPDTIIDKILLAEGSEYTDDPEDSGGPTKYGITQTTLSAYRGRLVSADEVSHLGAIEARSIYRQRYWHDPKIDLLGIINMKIAAEVMDTGVNAGPAVAIRILQRSLNGLNDSQKLWPDLVVDGKSGPNTAKALRAYLDKRGSEGEWTLLVLLNGLQAAFYLDLVERREKDERFLYGWLRERVAAQLK